MTITTNSTVPQRRAVGFSRGTPFFLVVRGQSPSSMGESFFFPCTRHVSMYLRPGIVILSFILSHGVLFFISVLWSI
jgi:hypothetical protein